MKQVVLITGVSGGIGRATANVFAEANWHVIGVDRNQIDNLPEIKHFIHADISNPKSMEDIFREVSVNEKRLDALINNAAVQICKPLLKLTSEDWDTTMATNVRSAFLTVREFHSLLKESGGAVVNVSSVHAIATSVGMAAYAASKGALVALTRSMALELGRDNIRVNAVLPGAVDTPMLRAGLNRGHLQGNGTDKLVHALGKKHVTGHVGEPEEIARAILFLADNRKSSFMTGQALTIDGGATARLSTE